MGPVAPVAPCKAEQKSHGSNKRPVQDLLDNICFSLSPLNTFFTPYVFRYVKGFKTCCLKCDEIWGR